MASVLNETGLVSIDNSKFENPIEEDSLFYHRPSPKRLTQLKKERSFVECVFQGSHLLSQDHATENLKTANWEYVIVLSNPDYRPDPDMENEEIKEADALNIFNECFKEKKTENVQEDSIRFQHEKEAFLSVFQTLPDCKDGKQVRFGGRVRNVNGEFLDNNKTAQDFTTLIRNVIIYKLVGGLGLEVRQLLSKTGEYIYLIIATGEEDLEIEAERTRYSKEMEFSLTDIQSLFPCDKNFRPFHLLEFNDSDIKDLFLPIKPFIEKALILTKKFHNFEYSYEPCGVTPVQLESYKKYLKLLNDDIPRIEKSIKNLKDQMFLFQKLIKESLEKVNTGVPKKDRLLTLWDQLDIEKPIPLYSEFRRE